MDIKIEAPGHPNQTALISYYRDRLQKKYKQYAFIKSIDVKVRQNSQEKAEVALSMKPEKGTMLFAKSADQNENRALEDVIKKMNGQIERYKHQHYHSSHNVAKK